MKKITIDDVKKAIWNNCFECDENNVEYYLHITENGDIVDGYSKADESFIYRVPFERYFPDFSDYTDYEGYDEDYRMMKYEEAFREACDDTEVNGNPIFEEVAKNLCDQANEWLEEQENE